MLAGLKVLYVIDYYYGTEGGTEGQLLHLIRGASLHGIVPSLAVLRATDFTRGGGHTVCSLLTLNIERLVSLRALLRLIWLAWFIRRTRIRVVHAFFNDAALAVPLFAKLGGAKVVVSRRDMGLWYTPANLRLLPFVNRFVDRVVANSAAVGEHAIRLERVPRLKVRVVHNGYSFASDHIAPRPRLRQELGMGDDDPIIGMVANLRTVKRHRDALEALAIVRREHPAVHLVLVGSGTLEGELRSRAQDLGLERCVHFLGTPAAVIPIVKHFRIGVLCSESEGFSNALLEYMACGVPPLCTRTGGNVELVQDGVDGLLFEVGDVTSLASLIAKVLTDRPLAERLASNARRTAEGYTLDRMVSGHLATYTEILSGPRSA